MKKPRIRQFVAVLTGIAAFPLVAGALSFSEAVRNLKVAVFNPLVALIIALALLVFVWGVGTYLTSQNPTKRKQGIEIMLAGIVGLALMLSVWGVVKLVMITISNRLPAVNNTSLPMP